jgi:hypothetical protein
LYYFNNIKLMLFPLAVVGTFKCMCYSLNEEVGSLKLPTT